MKLTGVRVQCHVYARHVEDPELAEGEIRTGSLSRHSIVAKADGVVGAGGGESPGSPIGEHSIESQYLEAR